MMDTLGRVTVGVVAFVVLFVAARLLEGPAGTCWGFFAGVMWTCVIVTLVVPMWDQ